MIRGNPTKRQLNGSCLIGGAVGRMSITFGFGGGGGGGGAWALFEACKTQLVVFWLFLFFFYFGGSRRRRRYCGFGEVFLGGVSLWLSVLLCLLV